MQKTIGHLISIKKKRYIKGTLLAQDIGKNVTVWFGAKLTITKTQYFTL
jgi:hypothetical protein